MADTISLLDKLTPQHLAGVCLLAGLFLLVIFTSAERGIFAVKIAGSAFVLALTFAANQAGTYALGMVIVATLVTDLEFIEKIFAIFLRNDSYFRWKIEAASIQQVTEKKLIETSEGVEPIPAPPAQSSEDQSTPLPQNPSSDSVNPAGFSRLHDPVLDTEQFELTVAQAIANGTPPFVLTGFTYQNIALENQKSGENFVVDILYKYMNIHVIIEVSGRQKFISRLSLIRLRNIARSYKNALQERHEFNVLVIPVLVVPSSVKADLYNDVFVLRFDGTKFSDDGHALERLSQIFSRAPNV